MNPGVLLTGSTKAKERRASMPVWKTEAGSGDGHSCTDSGKGTVQNLALVITDEQHRFGVRQRTALAEKGDPPCSRYECNADSRTLAIILYGDLSISVIDELPAKRLPSKTVWWIRRTVQEAIALSRVRSCRPSGVCHLPDGGGK